MIGQGRQGEIDFLDLSGSKRAMSFDLFIGSNKEHVRGGSRYAAEAGHLVVARGVVLLLIDITTERCIDKVDLLDVAPFAEMVALGRMKIPWVNISLVSVSDSQVVLSGDVLSRGYVIHFEISEGRLVFRWMNSSVSGIVAQYFGGKWVFGMEYDCPVAWTIETGDVHWRSKTPASTSEFYASGGWLVYHQAFGPVHCYEIKTLAGS